MANPASSHSGISSPPLCCRSPRPISTEANFPGANFDANLAGASGAKIDPEILFLISCTCNLSHLHDRQVELGKTLGLNWILKMQLKTKSIWKGQIQMVFFRELLSKHFLNFAPALNFQSGKFWDKLFWLKSIDRHLWLETLNSSPWLQVSIGIRHFSHLVLFGSLFPGCREFCFLASEAGGGLLEKQPRFRGKLGFIGELRGKLAN